MSSFTANLYSVVKNVMARTGGNAFLLVDTAGGYDPATDTDTLVTTEYPVRICIFDFALIRNGNLAQKDTLISMNDKQVFLDDMQSDGNRLPFRITPTGMRLRVGTDVYRITVVKEYNPTGNERIMYDLKVET